jgi:predicted aspartyl protease
MPLAFWPLALLASGVPQDGLAPTLPSPPLTPEQELARTVIALGEAESRMTVPVQIAGAGPYKFIIDTGAERTVISRQLAGNLRLPGGKPVKLTAMSGTTRVGTVVIPSISISSLPVEGGIHAPALDALHLGGLGLLGIDTLQNHVVRIDFDKQTMTVAPSEKRKRRSTSYRRNEVVVVAKSLFGQLIVTDAQFDRYPIRVVIDTGSPISVGNTALQKLVRRSMGALKPLQLTSATGEQVTTQAALVDRLRVGTVAFDNLPIAFADVPPFERFGLDDRPAMLLGMSTLKFFRQVEIDFANRQIRFLLPRQGVAPHCQVTTGLACAA